MSRVRELAFRTVNTGLLWALATLYRTLKVPTTFKVSKDGAAALFEGNWFIHHPREFGSTGNIDFAPHAEDATRDALFARMKSGDVFYDVGAHGGVFTITAMSRVPGAVVHSFEPQPEDLLANLSLNHLPTANVHRVAVGDQQGEVRMTTKRRSSNHVSATGDRVVQMVRIDEFAAGKGLPSPDWMKIDIEGLELAALKGSEQLIRQSYPTVICEINRLFDRFGVSIPELCGYMASLGYQIHRLVDGRLEPIATTSSLADLGHSADYNFWFVHESRSAN